MGLETNTLYYGDCLDWMDRWDDQSVDLIYLDPPFNSKANYNVLFSDHGAGMAQYQAFEDIWQWDSKAANRYAMYENAVGRPAHKAIVGLFHFLGPSGMMAYLTYMAERLEHMHRLLKPTGSIYYHCDPTASHYLKMIMDAIFGPQNFVNEISWHRSRSRSSISKKFRSAHDAILFYSRTTRRQFQIQYRELSPTSKSLYNRSDERGNYQLVPILVSGRRGGETGSIWRGIDPGPRGKNGMHWITTPKNLDQYDREDRIFWPRKVGGIPRLKYYLHESLGAPADDFWHDISLISSQSSESLGYPTQKPLALLERIIKASSNPGDVVLDPFCGCGTAIEAAKNLNRQWAGIDISSFAIDVVKYRRLKDSTIPTMGIPYDLQAARKLAKEKPFDFESWAVTRLPGFIPNTKQVADGGVDGRATLLHKPENFDSRRALAQVKGGKFSLSSLRDFIGVTDKHKAAVACFITLEPVATPAAREAIVSTGQLQVSGYVYPRNQIWPISDYFDPRRPVLPKMPLMADPYTGKPMQPILI